MLLLLDFDRTLLDWDGLISHLIGVCPPMASDIQAVLELPSGSPERMVVWRKLGELYDAGALSLTEADVMPFVYEDARRFVERHQTDIVIVTSGDPRLQTIKLGHAFPGTTFRDVIFCDRHDHKGIEVRAWAHGAQPPAVFVDDAIEQLESVARECPWITLFEMCRTKNGSGLYRTVHTLDDLEAYLATL